MAKLHTFATYDHAAEAHGRMIRLGHRAFSIFEFFGHGRPEWAFWTN